jgi:predicted Zn-dependent protease
VCRRADAVALVPDDGSLASARLAEHAGDRTGAIARLDRYLAVHPDDQAALDLCGYLLADANERLGDAARFLARARDMAPGDPAVLDSWGWLLLRQHQTRDAVRVLDHAARLAPREPEILFHLASAWAADGAPRTALAVLAQTDALLATAAVRQRIAELRRALAKP